MTHTFIDPSSAERRAQYEAQRTQSLATLDLANRLDAADVSSNRAAELQAVIKDMPAYFGGYADALSLAVRRIETVKATDRQAAAIIENVIRDLREKAESGLSVVDMTFATQADQPLMQQMAGLSRTARPESNSQAGNIHLSTGSPYIR